MRPSTARGVLLRQDEKKKSALKEGDREGITRRTKVGLNTPSLRGICVVSGGMDGGVGKKRAL